MKNVFLNKKSNLACFIKKANKIHNHKFDYSKSIYIDAKTKLDIICTKHGVFSQRPNDHLSGRGCPKCKIEKTKANGFKPLSQKQFLSRCFEIHGKKYDYRKTCYQTQHHKITITCFQHGDFDQLPFAHLSGQNCPKCAWEQKSNKISNTLEKAKKSSRLLKKVVLPSGKVEYVQGYEPQALKILLNFFDENDIVFGFKKVPKISYVDKNFKIKQYFPDFWIKSINTLVEVKSNFTEKIDSNLKNKEIGAILNGFNFLLIKINKRSI